MSKFLFAVVLCAVCLSGFSYGDEKASDGAKTEGNDAASSKTTPVEEKDIYDKAATCPHRFHMGCLLDVLEKSCTGLQALEACANSGKCKNLEELQRVTTALDPKNFEAVNKCCCSKAYTEGGYEDCKTPDPVCKKAIDNHLKTDLNKNVKLLKDCLKTKKQPACKKAIDAANWVREAVQKARGEMWPTNGCQMLAPPEPISKCGFDVKPEGRAIERADLYCDTIIWQFKEMGASDPFMEKCKDAPKLPKQLDEAQGSDAAEGEFDDGSEDPETVDVEDESVEEEDSPEGAEPEGDMEETEEEGAQPEGDESEEDPEAEEPQNMKDEL